MQLFSIEPVFGAGRRFEELSGILKQNDGFSISAVYR
jgi:hypothetical protein